MKNRTTMTTTGPGSKKPNRVMVEPRKSPAIEAREVNMMSRAMMDAAENFYNNISFKNKDIDLFNRKRYDISSEFDGQEVQGTMTERPTIGGGMVETERYNMPGGGSRMERTRFNAEGQPVKRVIRDKKINPR